MKLHFEYIIPYLLSTPTQFQLNQISIFVCNNFETARQFRGWEIARIQHDENDRGGQGSHEMIYRVLAQFAVCKCVEIS